MRPKRVHPYPVKQILEELKLDNRYEIVRLGPGDYSVIMDFMGRAHELYRCHSKYDAEAYLMSYIEMYENPEQIWEEEYDV
jgi:hypothetical protein